MSVRTCTVICNAGPNGEPLRCAYKPRHKGDHSWATLPTFVTPRDNSPLEIHPARNAVTGTLAHHGVAVLAMPEWWAAALVSLGDDFPHVQAIRRAMAEELEGKA
jgi:hypothetical protein